MRNVIALFILGLVITAAAWAMPAKCASCLSGFQCWSDGQCGSDCSCLRINGMGAAGVCG